MRSIDKINYYLKLRGEDTSDLSEAIGVSTSAISQWNNGKTIPSNRSIKKAADHFGVSVTDLLDDDEKTPAAQGDGLPEKDARLLAWFRSLPVEKQKAILTAQDAPEGLV